MKGKISACLYIGDPQQSLSKQMPVWWETLTSQPVRPVWTPGYRAMPAFCPIVFPPYDNDERQRQTVTISEKKRLNARVAMSRELILKAFFPGNLNLEREKGALTTSLPLNPAGRYPGGCCDKKSHFLPAFVRCPRISQLQQPPGKRSLESIMLIVPIARDGNMSLLPLLSSFGYSNK